MKQTEIVASFMARQRNAPAARHVAGNHIRLRSIEGSAGRSNRATAGGEARPSTAEFVGENQEHTAVVVQIYAIRDRCCDGVIQNASAHIGARSIVPSQGVRAEHAARSGSL